VINYEYIDPEQQLSSQDFHFVESFLQMTGRTQIGWHYVTDIVWIYSHVKEWPRDYKILDAGGGYGPVQFLLAEMGFHVTNVDMVLSEPPAKYVQRYQTKLEELPSFTSTSYLNFINSDQKWLNMLKKIIKSSSAYKKITTYKYCSSHEKWRSNENPSDRDLGSINWIKGNLCDMPELASGTFDAVVSLSAWEHIPYHLLPKALLEIRRVLVDGAKYAVTTSATEKEETWWHEPSQSNCFSLIDLENIFGAVNISSEKAEDILEKYKNCAYLKENLADFYKKSGKYGMPWGKWDPKYIPVGISQ